jgi:hypothetical protein
MKRTISWAAGGISDEAVTMAVTVLGREVDDDSDPTPCR